jgi:hypothetical protein
MPRTKPEDSTIEVVTEPNEILIKRDEFASPEYLDPYAKLPRIQALRGTSDNNCGYFIPVDQMAKAGWLDFESNQLTTYTYESSGNEEQGLMLFNPRMLVCVKSPLLGFDRKATLEEEQLVIVGQWKRQYKEVENIGNCQFYEVILLNTENKPLHTVPLSYVAKGANQATFSQEWQKLIDQITICHAITNGIAARPKDSRFKSLCVFSFNVKRESVGKKQKSFACRVVTHEAPNLETWRNYFVGFNHTIKHQIWEGLQPTKPLLIPGETVEVTALPGNLDDDN